MLTSVNRKNSMTGKPASSAETAVISLDQNSAEHTSRELSKVLSIKLSKAREHLAVGFGFNSYNALLTSLKSGKDEFTSTEIFLNKIDESVQRRHKRPLTEDEKTLITSKFGGDINQIHQKARYSEFLQYVLIESDEATPLIDSCYYQHILPPESECNALLVESLRNGQITKELTCLTQAILKKLRPIMSLNSIEHHQTKTKAYLNRIFKQYKTDVLSYLTTDIYKIYWLPITYHCKSNPRSYMPVPFDGEVLNENSEMPPLLFGSKVVRLADVIQPNSSLYNEDLWGDPFNTINYQGSLVPRLHHVRNCKESAYSPTFGDNTEFLPRVSVILGEWNGSSTRNIEESSLAANIYISEREEKDGVFEETEFLALPVVVKGKYLTKKQIPLLSESLRNANSNKYNEGYYAFGDAVLPDKGQWSECDKFIASFMGSSLRSAFDTWDNSAAFFINEELGELMVISGDGVGAPLGQGNEDVCEALQMDITFYECSSLSSVIDIATAVKRKIKPYHTLVNNMAEVPDWLDDAGTHCFDYRTIDYIEESGFGYEYIPCFGLGDIVDNLALNGCRNVYMVNCDREMFANPTIIIGFDESGQQTLNVTLYTHYSSYNSDYWAFLDKLHKAIKVRIEGYLVDVESEFEIYSFMGKQTLATDLSEDEVVQEINPLTNQSNPKPEWGSYSLFEVVVECPKNLGKEELQKLLRRELFTVGGGNYLPNLNRLNTKHSNILLDEKIEPPSYIYNPSKDRAWYRGYSTNRIHANHHPINVGELKTQSVTIYTHIEQTQEGQGGQQATTLAEERLRDLPVISFATEAYTNAVIAYQALSLSHETAHNYELESGDIVANIIADDLLKQRNIKP